MGYLNNVVGYKFEEKHLSGNNMLKEYIGKK